MRAAHTDKRGAASGVSDHIPLRVGSLRSPAERFERGVEVEPRSPRPFGGTHPTLGRKAVVEARLPNSTARPCRRLRSPSVYRSTDRRLRKRATRRAELAFPERRSRDVIEGEPGVRRCRGKSRSFDTERAKRTRGRIRRGRDRGRLPWSRRRCRTQPTYELERRSHVHCDDARGDFGRLTKVAEPLAFACDAASGRGARLEPARAHPAAQRASSSRTTARTVIDNIGEARQHEARPMFAAVDRFEPHFR